MGVAAPAPDPGPALRHFWPSVDCHRGPRRTLRGVLMRRFVRALARAYGYDVVRHVPPVEAAVPPGGDTGLPPDVQECDRAVLERVAGFTMTGVDRQIALVQAVRYAV